MPHCIIEHSPAISASQVNQLVYQGALASQLFEPDGSDIKVRSLAYEHYQTGVNKEDFVHVTLRILSGRSATDKLDLSKAVMSKLNNLSLEKGSITVEIVDIDRDSYSKRVISNS